MVQKSPIEGQDSNNTSDIHPLQATGSYFKNMLLDVLAQSTSFEQNHLNGILQDGFRDLERWLEKENHSDFETDCINNLRIALEDGIALLQSPKINIDDVYKIESRIEQYCHSLNERIEVIPKNFFIDNPLKFDWTTPEPTRSIRIIGTDQAGNSFNITSNISREEVNNIDTEGPKGTLSYSTTALTNGDVTVTINLNKDVFNTPAGWTKINATTFTKVYTTNSSETVNFVDVAGNAGSVNVLVTNIDIEESNQAPIASKELVSANTINTLNQQLTTVRALDLNLYTPESIARIQAAITKGEQALTKFLQREINEQRVLDAIKDLVEVAYNLRFKNRSTIGTQILNQSGNEGKAFNLNISENFSDEDGNTLIYSAMGLPMGVHINPATGIISGTLPNVGSNTPYTVTVMATDGVLSASQSFTLTVMTSNLPPESYQI